ncbi:hypothetical protein CYMTET_49249 [Cymbomonas tetramitiformis]|uniref:Uncharacterized protein n=1 Tax=Cymbomonas tetramitiformis TaxID=36881 RepID=A0AAE0BS89_9CHLO|nr:hypothetical protein CYMTET_49249 [Cymbomonas tetramitiformis]
MHTILLFAGRAFQTQNETPECKTPRRALLAGTIFTVTSMPGYRDLAHAESFEQKQAAKEARKAALLAAAKAKATGGEVPDIPEYESSFGLSFDAAGSDSPAPQKKTAPAAVATKPKLKNPPSAAPPPKTKRQQQKEEEEKKKKLSPEERAAQKKALLAAAREKALANAD